MASNPHGSDSMTQQTQSVLTPEVKAMIGVSGEVVEAWGKVNEEYLRRFTQALMDPDPRYWDHEFAQTTQYGRDHNPSHHGQLYDVSYPSGPRRPNHQGIRRRPDVRRYRQCGASRNFGPRFPLTWYECSTPATNLRPINTPGLATRSIFRIATRTSASERAGTANPS